MATHTDDKLELLKRVPLFAGSAARTSRQVGRLADEVDVPAGHVLMREGRPGSGVLRDRRRRGPRSSAAATIVRTMGPGDFLGEIALVDRRPADGDGHDDDRQPSCSSSAIASSAR